MRLLKQQIDRWAIRAASKSLPRLTPRCDQQEEVHRLLARPRLFDPPEIVPKAILGSDFTFQFPSSVVTPFPGNNMVHGKLVPAGKDWRKKPSVLLLHGWNAEMHYTSILPIIGKALTTVGINGVLMELPYHLHRRPPKGQAITNFISEDIPRMIEATAQAIADVNSVIHWLKSEGSPAVGLWGFSLGGWLVGLHVCASAAQDAAVLMTPVSNLERAVRDLDFCHPIRSALEVAPADLQMLNLSARQPKIEPSRIQLVQAEYDVFVPGETYQELASAWRLPRWEVVPQSHISILVSKKSTEQSINWLEERLGASS